MATNTAAAQATDESRQDRRRARTRGALLRAAKHLLATKGFHATKIADIAAAADVGTGTFYLHFPTKDALFTDLARETAQELKDEIDRAKAAYADPAEKARVATATFFRFARDHRDVFRILFGHSAQFDTLLHELHQVFIADSQENYVGGVEAGVFVSMRAPIVANAIVGMLSQVVSWWIDHEEVSIDEITQTTQRLLMFGMAQSKENP